MPFEGSNYTVNRAMYEVISYGCGYTGITNDEGSYIFGGRLRAFVMACFTPSSGGLICCLYTAKKQLSQTNRSMPDEVCKWPCILSVNLSRISLNCKYRSKAK